MGFDGTSTGFGGSGSVGPAAEIEIAVTEVTGGTSGYFLTVTSGILSQTNPATYTGFPIRVDVTNVLSSFDYSILFTNPTIGTLGASANFGYIETTSSEFNSRSSSTATDQASYQFSKSRAGVTIISNDDRIGTITWSGYDGAAYQATAAIESIAAGTISAGTVPQALQFLTGATNTASIATKMFIGPTGIVGIGWGGYTTSATGRLDVKAPGAASTDVAIRVRNSADLQDLFVLNGDGGFTYKNVAGGIIFQTKYTAGVGSSFALGDNTVITNAGFSDVLIGPGTSFGATTGTGRIVIGYAATNTGAFYGISIGQSATVSNDGGLAIGFSAQASGQGSQSWGMNMRSSATSSIMFGSNYSFAQTNNIANSFMLQLGLASSAGNFQDFFISGKSNVVLRNNTALTAGTHYNTTAVNAYTVHIGTAPNGIIVDAFQMYTADWNGAGTATPFFLNEENHTIKLFRGAALTAQETTITFTEPVTPDYAIQGVTSTVPFGFVNANEGNTFIGVVENLQVRVAQLEARLQASGQIA